MRLPGWISPRPAPRSAWQKERRRRPPDGTVTNSRGSGWSQGRQPERLLPLKWRAQNNLEQKRRDTLAKTKESASRVLRFAQRHKSHLKILPFFIFKISLRLTISQVHEQGHMAQYKTVWNNQPHKNNLEYILRKFGCELSRCKTLWNLFLAMRECDSSQPRTQTQ